MVGWGSVVDEAIYLACRMPWSGGAWGSPFTLLVRIEPYENELFTIL
jgi:hypothetical protein